MRLNPLTGIDFYKADHRRQYPEGTQLVYSNFTPRADKLCLLDRAVYKNEVTFFGLQYFIKEYLIDVWNKGFFQLSEREIVEIYQRRMDNALGKGAIPVEHIKALHNLGYLPLKIKALPEGAQVPIKVPCLTIWNTKPEFFWLTNYLESVMSCYLWKATTSATTARAYRKMMTKFAIETGAPLDFIDFQGHDFSFRGMSGHEDAMLSGGAHLTSFKGTDTVWAIDFLEKYYNANSDKELVGCSVPATEHSVMCMGGQEDELGTFTRLITELYPTGIVSIVSDTWDFWQVINSYAIQLKNVIMKREGKVVFRPDSGNPVKIICGDNDAHPNSYEHIGAVQCLWNTFGGTINKEGFKMLDPHVGLIYGDSITPARAWAIMEGLKAKGFASSNIVFGIGSYTYEYVTRDTFGFAVKSTAGMINGEKKEIFKDPITDDGIKKSAKGFVKITMEGGKYKLNDQQPSGDEKGDLMVTVFEDGKLLVDHTLADIRKRIISDV